jgi:hypothetical protein
MRPIFTVNQMSPYNGTPFAGLMLGSLRRHIPNAMVFQFSDNGADEVDGVDQVIKSDFEYDENTYPEYWFHFLCYTFKAMSSCSDAIVSCDADLFFTGDVSQLLEGDYDIAICKRPQGLVEDDTSWQYRTLHPYNCGFFIIKNESVAKCCRNALLYNMLKKDHLAIGQHVIGLVVNSGQFKVKFLDGMIYNRMPLHEDDFDPSVVIWHFKGHRKDWMPEWAKKYGNGATQSNG